MRTERLAKNVATGIELPASGRPNAATGPDAQLQALAAHTDGHETLTLVMGYCGLRFGEAVALRRRDVTNRKITVRTSVTGVTGQGLVEDSTKTGRVRWVPVPALVWERLKGELPPDADASVFPGKNGGFLTNGEYRWAFNPAATDAGIPGLVPHELRHTCASLAISAGANIKAVQRLLGHQTASMTLDRYGHLYSDDLEQVAKQLDSAGRCR